MLWRQSCFIEVDVAFAAAFDVTLAAFVTASVAVSIDDVTPLVVASAAVLIDDVTVLAFMYVASMRDRWKLPLNDVIGDDSDFVSISRECAPRYPL